MNQSTMLFYTLIKQDTSSNVSQTKQCMINEQHYHYKLIKPDTPIHVSQTKQCMINQQHYYYKLIKPDTPIHVCQTKQCMEQIINMICDTCCGFYKIDKSNVSFHF